MDEKLFSKNDVFHICCDVLANITQGMNHAGFANDFCILFLQKMALTMNMTLQKGYGFTKEEIRTYAAGAILDLHVFTAEDKEQ